MSEHTAGPWEFDGVCQIVEVKRPHMRVCFLPSDHREYASSVPNGRLIAAAPELLEVLQALVSQILEYERINNLAPNPGRQDCWDNVTRAKAVIAKALSPTSAMGTK